MTTHGVYLAPSHAEGWGHVIAEALSAGAIVLAPGAGVPAEVVGPAGVAIPVADRLPFVHVARTLLHATQWDPNPHAEWLVMDVAGIETAVASVLALTPAECLEAAENARERYRALAAGFREAFRGLLGRLGLRKDPADDSSEGAPDAELVTKGARENAPPHLVHPPRRVLAFPVPPAGRHVDPLPDWTELRGPFKDPQGRHPAWDWVLPCLLERPDELLVLLEATSEDYTEDVQRYVANGEAAFIRDDRLVAVYIKAGAVPKLDLIYRHAAFSQSALGPLLAIRAADVLPIVLL